MRRILLVEDDKSLASTVASGLRENGYDVVAARTLRAARASMDGGAFDLAILDLGLPDGEGLHLLTELRSSSPHLPAIITTARGALERRLTAFDAGADDYLVKPYAFAELLARIRIQFRHAEAQSVLHFKIADLEIDTITRTVTRAGEAVILSPKEFDLLAFLAAADAQVVTREMLARDVWHLRSWTPSLDNVIDVHVSRLRDKIDRNRTPRLLHTVRGAGFVLREIP